MITVRRTIWLVLLLCGLVEIALAQSVETRPLRGFMPNSDHMSSPLDSIDVVNGNLNIQIPLASMVPGRAGFGFDLNLVYNSHLYDMDVDPQSGAKTLFNQFTMGGWTYSIKNYKVELERRSSAGDCATLDERDFRVRVGLPDGSLHLMHLRGSELEEWQQDGFISTGLDGVRSQCAHNRGLVNTTGTLTYYSSDGSFLKMEIPANGSDWTNQFWTLYFPDGHRVVGKKTEATDLYDANGNHIRVENCWADWPSMNKPVTILTDDFDRQIRIDFNVNNANMQSGESMQDVVHQPTGPNPGDEITWTINWVHRWFGNNRPYDCGLSAGYCFSYFPFWVIDNIVVPSTPQTVYRFGYSDDLDGGYGELDYMQTAGDPTHDPLTDTSGAKYRYRYKYENPTIPPTTFQLVHQNSVSQKTVTHDGMSSPDISWGYSFDDTSSFFVDYSTGAQTKNSFFNRGFNSSEGWRKGLVYRIDQPLGSVIKREWSKNGVPFLTVSGSQDSNNPYVSKETVTAGNIAGSTPKTGVTSFTYDKNGNLLNRLEKDWGVFNPGILATDIEVGGTAKRETKLTYYVSTPLSTDTSTDSPSAYWRPHQAGYDRLNALKRQEIWDSELNKAVAVSEYQYDNPNKNGNRTVELRWDNTKPGAETAPSAGTMSSANSQILTRGFDDYGNLIDIYAPEVRTRIEYGSHSSQPALPGPYPTAITYGYGSSSQRSWTYSWNYVKGSVTSKKDLDNNVVTSYTYDQLNRPLSVIEDSRTVNGVETGLRRMLTTYHDIDRTLTVKRDRIAFGDGQLQSITSYDMLGRVKLVQTSDGSDLSSGTNGIKVDSVYLISGGRRVITSTPYRNADHSDITLEWTCTSYDTLGRVTTVARFNGSSAPVDCVTNATGITQSSYDANKLTTTDPAGKKRDQYSDGLGRMIQVNEDPTGLNYQTDYQYDALDNLTLVTQGSSQKRTFDFNSLSQLITTRSPESGFEPNYSPPRYRAVQYTYTANGDLLTRTDPRGYRVTMGYDEFHRVTTKTYSNDGGLTPSVAYNYDIKGHLQNVTSSAATIAYGNYDVLGRAGSQSETLAGGSVTYSLNYTYFLNDELASLQYPSGKTITYSQDNAGRLTKAASSTKTYVDLTVVPNPATAYTPDGRITQMKLGNDVWETREYHVPGSPTLFKLGTSAGSNNLMQLDYSFPATNNNGNLDSQVIRRGGTVWTQKYHYDSVNRLDVFCESTAGSCDSSPNGSGWGQKYGYDRFGNGWVASSSIVHETHEPTASTNFDSQTNRISVQNSAFDDAGNQIVYTPFTLAYDAENRLIKATGSGGLGTAWFSYDGDGRRAGKAFSFDGDVAHALRTFYVYDIKGRMVAEYSEQPAVSAGTSYPFTDMLGSTRATTGDKPQGGSASIIECYDYLPFGRMFAAGVDSRDSCHPSAPDTALTSKLPQKFTGKERDGETGLDYFGARYFSGSQARFTSMDKPFADQHRADPQSWNLYAYVANNPLRFVDVNGRFKTENHDAIINGAFGGLSEPQRGVLQAASLRVDGWLNGGQSSKNAYKHGMRGNFEKPEEARKNADAFISEHEGNASTIAKQSGVTDSALNELGEALHTVTDRLSPTHAGEQLWTGAGEPGVLGVVGGVAGYIVGAAIDGVRAISHGGPEATISLNQYHDAIDAVRTEYLKTFGQDAFFQATGCEQVAGCKYNDSALPAQFTKKP